MKYIVLIQILVCGLNVFSQQKSDSLRVNEEIKTARSLFYEDPDSTISLLKATLDYAESENYYQGQHIALNQLGIFSLLTGDEEASILFFYESLNLAIAQNDLKQTSASLSNIGNYYNHVGNLAISLDFYLRALKIKRAINDKNGMGVLYTNIGIIYDKQGHHKKALNNYEDALVIKKELNDSISIANDLINIGIVYAELNEFESAESSLTSAIEMAKILNDDYLLCLAFSNLAEVYFQLQDYESSLDFANAGLELGEKFNIPGSLSQAYHVLSQLKEKDGNIRSAIELEIESLKLIRISGQNEEQIPTLARLAMLENQIGGHQQAYQYLSEQKEIEDSLKSIEIQRNLDDLTLKYEQTITEQELVNKKHEVEGLEKDKTIKNYTIVAVVLGAIFIISILLFLFWQKRNQIEKQKIKEQLLQQESKRLSLELEHRNKELLSFAMQTANKNEAIQTIKEQLRDEIKEKNADFSDRRIEHLFRQVENTENDWKEFRMRFEQIDQNFFKVLSKKFPSLTDTDLRICAMIKLKLTSKEIASILNITQDSVNKSRYRLRKKLTLSKEEDLNQFISNID